jgi:hypothetical protein
MYVAAVKIWTHFDNGQLKKFLFLVTAAILNGGRSELKVTTLVKDLARNISAKYGSNPSSGSWEEVCFTYFP